MERRDHLEGIVLTAHSSKERKAALRTNALMERRDHLEGIVLTAHSSKETKAALKGNVLTKIESHLLMTVLIVRLKKEREVVLMKENHLIERNLDLKEKTIGVKREVLEEEQRLKKKKTRQVLLNCFLRIMI